MSDPDEPAAEATSDHAPARPIEHERADPGDSADPSAAVEPSEPADATRAQPAEPAPDTSAKPARATVGKPARRDRKRRRIGRRAGVVLTKVRRSRQARYQLAVGVAAAFAVIGVSAYVFQDRPGGRDDHASGGPASASPPVLAPRERVDPSRLAVTETGTLNTDRRTLRVVSARMDLTAKEQLAWAADDGRTVGNARCTQNFRFHPREEPKVRPTMLMCWRTSKDKSVYAIAVDLDKRPSDKDLAKTVDRTWVDLG